MALDPKTLLAANEIDVTDPVGYPLGKAKDVTDPLDPGSIDGTPWKKEIINDIFGFQQAILDAAGVAPSGNADKVGASQYLDALLTLGGKPPSSFYFGGTVSTSSGTGKIAAGTAYAVTVGGLGDGYQSSWDTAGGTTGAGWSTTLASVIANTGGASVKRTKIKAHGCDLIATGSTGEEHLWTLNIDIDWVAGTVSGFSQWNGGIPQLFAHYRFGGTTASPTLNQTRGGLAPAAIPVPAITIDVANRRVTEFPEMHNLSVTDGTIDCEITEYK